ncbi:hypothetical protein D3C78_1565120 [compost metagenome]
MESRSGRALDVGEIPRIPLKHRPDSALDQIGAVLAPGPDVFRTTEHRHKWGFLVLVDVLHIVEIPALVTLHRFRRPIGPAHRNTAVMALAH